jgi:hypothetical protein
MSKKKSNKGQKTQNVTIIFDPTIPDSEKTMLHCIENVLLYGENSELKEENMEIMKGYLDYISDLQDIKPMQALLLSFFVEKSSDGDSVTIASLARNLSLWKSLSSMHIFCILFSFVTN